MHTSIMLLLLNPPPKGCPPSYHKEAEKNVQKVEYDLDWMAQQVQNLVN